MITTKQSNYENNYNAFQLSLPLDLGLKIDPDDEVVSFLKALEGVNLNRYLKRKECRGRKGYDNVMLLKIVLFARMIGFDDLRSLESLCRHDIRFMYITDEERPSFMAFERLLMNYLTDDIDHIFFDISENTGKLMNTDKTVQYIDGTKFEANANRYSFVYKTRIVNAREKLFSKITEEIASLNSERGFDFSCQQFYCAQEIGYIAQYLMECMVKNDISPVYGKGKRKTALQRRYDQFLKYYIKLEEYECWLDIIGDAENALLPRPFARTFSGSSPDVAASCLMYPSIRSGLYKIQGDSSGMNRAIDIWPVSSGCLDVFGFTMTEGNRSALELHGNAIIPESLAARLFNGKPATGQMLISVNGLTDLTIAGVSHSGSASVHPASSKTLPVAQFISLYLVGVNVMIFGFSYLYFCRLFRLYLPLSCRHSGRMCSDTADRP